MSVAKTPNHEKTSYPDLPNGWSWWSGNTSESHYTSWFGTDYRQGGDLVRKNRLGGYEGEVYWDKGGDGKHHVAIYPITGIRDDGGPEVSPYPDARGTYSSKEEALNAVPKLIEELKEEER